MEQGDWSLLKQFFIGLFFAVVGAYIRASRDQTPFTINRLSTFGAESVLCAILSMGIGSALDFSNLSVHYAIAGGLGLIGTRVITDLIVKFLGKKVG